jgi:hypothetical protein
MLEMGGRKVSHDHAKEIRINEGEGTIPCGICGIATRMRTTKRCDRCWELETRIKASPDIARWILARISKE